MICKTCDEYRIPSDIIGEFCVECFSYNPRPKTIKDDFACIWCGEISKSLINDLCSDCYSKLDTLSGDEREKLYAASAVG